MDIADHVCNKLPFLYKVLARESISINCACVIDSPDSDLIFGTGTFLSLDKTK